MTVGSYGAYEILLYTRLDLILNGAEAHFKIFFPKHPLPPQNRIVQ